MTLRNLGMILTAAASMAAGSSLASANDFWLVNKTGLSIREVQVSAASKNQWTNERLGAPAVLENNQSAFYRSANPGACAQDVKVFFAGDQPTVVLERIDLCKANKLSLKYDAATKTASALRE